LEKSVWYPKTMPVYASCAIPQLIYRPEDPGHPPVRVPARIN